MNQKIYGSSASDVDDGLRGWIHSYSLKHHWRVAAWIEVEDLIQDGYMIVAKIRQRYNIDSYQTNEAGQDTDPERVGKPLTDSERRRWFVSLVKTSFTRYVCDLARKRSATPEIAFAALFTPEDDDTTFLETVSGGDTGLAELFTQISKAPEEVRAVLNLFLTDEGLEKLRAPFQQYRGMRESQNRRLCRLIGADPNRINVVEMIYACLTT